jgi:hypothetical protein
MMSIGWKRCSRRNDQNPWASSDTCRTIDGVAGAAAIGVSLGKAHLLDHAGGANRDRRGI